MQLEEWFGRGSELPCHRKHILVSYGKDTLTQYRGTEQNQYDVRLFDRYASSGHTAYRGIHTLSNPAFRSCEALGPGELLLRHTRARYPSCDRDRGRSMPCRQEQP